MLTPRELDVLIVGSGPAGAATGMALAARRPDLAARTLCIDKQHHPREKICGGGLTGQMLDQLALLGVELDVPSITIERCVAAYGPIRHEVPLQRTFRVIRRDAFDAQLARTMVARGVELSEGEAYLAHAPRDDGRLDVRTTRGTYVVRALVAADGAGSKIARGLESRRRPKVHLAQIDVPMPEGTDPNAMVYDFSGVTGELKGYAWVFPTPLHDDDGRPMVNVGLTQWGSTRAGGGMLPLLRRALQRYGFDLGERRIKFHPEWAFDPSFAFAAPNVLTVGDAAGIDPMFGEGLSQCLEYGHLAAAAIDDADVRGDWAFASYRRRVLRSPLGREMRLLRVTANRFYREGNGFWVSFVFNGSYLPRLMAAQGEGRVRLYRRVLPVSLRALWHLLAGNKRLPHDALPAPRSDLAEGTA